jgi:hypothetical protein
MSDSLRRNFLCSIEEDPSVRYIIHPDHLTDVLSHRRHKETRAERPVGASRLFRVRGDAGRFVTGNRLQHRSLGDEAGDPVADYRNVLVALWVARRLGLNTLETLRYARDLLVADREEPGFGDVARKVAADLRRAGLIACGREVRQRVLAAQHTALRSMLSPA